MTVICNKLVGPVLQPIKYLEASAGWGKTYSCIKQVTEVEIPSGNTRWVYVGKGLKLCEESCQLAFSFNQVGVYHSVSSEDKSTRAPVGIQIEDILTSADGFDILFITHSAFLALVKKGKGNLFYQCNLLVDESMDILELHDMEIPKNDDTLAKVLISSEGGYVLNRGVDYTSRTLKSKMVTKEYKAFVSTLALDRGVCYKDVGKRTVTYSMYYLHDLRGVLLYCSRFILIGAKLSDTINSGLWGRQGIKLSYYTDVALKRTAYPNHSRVRIYYLTNEVHRPTGCSSTLLDGLWDYKYGKYISKDKWSKAPDGQASYSHHRTIFEEYVNRAIQVVKKDYIYTANKKRKHLMPEDNGESVSVPYGCFGWNHLSHHTDAVSLFTFKPNGVRGKLLSRIGEEYQFPEIGAKFEEERMNEASYQTLTRGALRDFSKPEEQITWVVPDLKVAMYIKDNHVSGAIIDSSISMDLPKGTINNGGKNKATFTEEYQLSKKEANTINVFKNSVKHKENREATHEELVNKLTKYREGVARRSAKADVTK